MAPPPAHLVAATPTGHDVAGAIASTKTLHVLEARVVTAEQRSLLDCLDAQKTETTENNTLATFEWLKELLLRADGLHMKLEL